MVKKKNTQKAKETNINTELDEDLVEQEVQQEVEEEEEKQEQPVFVQEAKTKPDKPKPVRRTKPGIFKYQKIGGGTLRGIPGHQMIKPKQIFMAAPEDIPQSFRDSIVCLEQKAEFTYLQAEDKAMNSATPTFKLIAVSKYTWNVVNAKGRPINPKPLTKKLATELLKTVN
jgi:hypothetical protein